MTRDRENNLIGEYIPQQVGDGVDDAKLISGVPIWIVVAQIKDGVSQEEVMESYKISEGAINAALAYYKDRRHKRFIDARITLNRGAFIDCLCPIHSTMRSSLI